MNDTVDKLVLFLGKRSGIDKLVKTIQYTSKLAHWHLLKTHPEIANRAKQWEIAAGLSRKAYRTGQFLTAFNDLRRNPGRTDLLRTLAVLGNAGQMVYYFFDHLLWLARIGVIDGKITSKMGFISAFGEALWYVFNITADLILITAGIREERRIVKAPSESEQGKAKIEKIKMDRVMRLMGMAADSADFAIAIAEVEPNPFCNHVITLGISGLISAWAGWYRNWPS